MKIKTSELIGLALDWAVAVCEKVKPIATKKKYSNGWLLYEFKGSTIPLEYSTRWSQGGPIIQQNGIGLLFDTGSACREPRWFATPDDQCTQENYEGEHFDPTFMVDESVGMSGPTPLIAAMRCYVASRMGDEVEVPEGLLC